MIRNLQNNIRQWTNWQTLLQAAGMFAFFMMFMALVQFSTPNMPDNDGFYHIKMAYLMRTEGLKPVFTWLPLTILNVREYYDHHFLFHVLLIPFTFGNLVTGAKWAAVIFASFSFMMIWRLFKYQKIPFSAVWAVGLVAVSEAFIYRMSITRAQSLSLALLALALHWLLTGRHARLVLAGFVYVWLYNAFPLLLAVTGAYVMAVGLLERRLAIMPFVYSGLGIVLGLSFNPYFPYNITFAFQHILPKLVEATAIRVGNEWFPYTTGQLLENSLLSLLLFFSSVLALGVTGRRMDTRTATALFLTGLFGVMLFQARRFVEYFPPFVLILAAFAWAPVLSSQAAVNWVNAAPHNWKRALRPLTLAALTLVFLAPFLWKSFQGSKENIQNSKPYQLYAGASAWLAANTPSGERVFQTDWDDFPRLFFYNTHNTYLIGLDPTYMQLYDSDLYDQWVAVTRGEIDNPSRLIEGSFGARYILTDQHHAGFLKQANSDPHLRAVYSDDDAVVFQVVDD